MIRKEVKWFAEHMESRLQENNHKTGWEDCTVDFLSSQINRNLNELNGLFEELPANYSVLSANIIRQCSDISNYAMMIADISNKYVCKYDPPIYAKVGEEQVEQIQNGVYEVTQFLAEAKGGIK
ncbi:hypothetical protein [Bacillus sp. 166amftsu]|uniref:hypothetical protein n=1 Tax=Bacillus sp. 166amftsu TaxID=1761753 RepID=UPI000899D522|nr:hypothetical protein [Bacillus sp. 166amftsu]SDY43510.1 hypothetical protein SAMN04488156_101380 [Bacillus sp. 166amftsu]